MWLHRSEAAKPMYKYIFYFTFYKKYLYIFSRAKNQRIFCQSDCLRIEFSQFLILMDRFFIHIPPSIYYHQKLEQRFRETALSSLITTSKFKGVYEKDFSYHWKSIVIYLYS